MSEPLKFSEAAPEAAASRLDPGAIHLWRIPYAPVQGRAPLIALLGTYLGRPAAEVVLDQVPGGKPRLALGAFAMNDRGLLEFNWSHSGDYALIALARGNALGVDIERFGKERRALEIARRFFAPTEAEALARIEARARDDAFIGLWCAKEAILKADGAGISFGLERLVFARAGDVDWRLARIDAALGAADDWTLKSFDAAPGYHGTLAWRGAPRKVLGFAPPADDAATGRELGARSTV